MTTHTLTCTLLLLAACLPEKGDDVSCGEGTHLEGSTCVGDAPSDDSGEPTAEGGGSEGGGEDGGGEGGGDSYTVCASGGAPYTDIQDAVDDASDGDTITVCAGTYGPVDLSRRDLTLQGVDGSEVTTIDGGSQTPITIVDTPTGVSVSGFTLTASPITDGDLCGIEGTYAIAALSDLRLTGCNTTGSRYAFGIYLVGSDVTITGLIVEDNVLQGGLLNATTGGSLVLRHSIFRNNTASGGGIPVTLVDVGGTELEMSNNLIYNNDTYQQPVNLNVVGAAQWVYNNVIYNNTATFSEGQYGTIRVDGAVEVYNNIIANNTSGIAGTGGNFSYNDIWGNALYDIPNSDRYGWTFDTLEANISSDPKFTDPDAGDFTLTSFSPCLDAGNPISGYDDVDGSTNDIGAYGGPFGSW